MPGGEHCFAHAPELANDRQAWAARGGRNKNMERRLNRLVKDADALETPELLRLLSGAMLLALGRTLEPSHLSALSAAAKTLEGIRTASELQARLDALEEALEASQRRRYGA